MLLVEDFEIIFGSILMFKYLAGEVQIEDSPKAPSEFTKNLVEAL